MTTLLFVYNAADGVFAAIGDAVHKAVSPETYPCSLCAITYGAVSMRPEWRAYLKSLPYPVRFHHCPDFCRAYPDLNVALPAILFAKGDAPPRVIVDAATLNQVRDLQELIAILNSSLPSATGIQEGQNS
jgi:hypothetical protein